MKKFAFALLALATALAITPAAKADTFTVAGLIVDNGSIQPGLYGVSAEGTSGTYATEVPNYEKLTAGAAGTSNTYTLLSALSGGPVGDSFTVTATDGHLITFYVTSASGPCDQGNLACGSGTITDGSGSPVEATWSASTAAQSDVVSFTFDAGPTPTPEPSSLVLLGTGLLGLAFVTFRKAKSSGLVLHT